MCPRVILTKYGIRITEHAVRNSGVYISEVLLY